MAPPPAADPDDPQALVVTHRFASGDEGTPYTAIIRLQGQRVGAGLRASPRDTFTREETVADVVPGTGPVAVTTWIYGIDPGEWQVKAELVGPADRVAKRSTSGRGRTSGPTLDRAGWSWRRWQLTQAPEVAVATRWALLAPLARTPAVVPGSFTALAVLGIVASFVVQAMLLDRLGAPVGGGLFATFLAIVAGIAGAKLWHMVLQARPWRDSIRQGWSVDGFLVTAPLVAIVAVLVLAIPIGTYLDSATPGMYVAVAIGRLGCFFTGCCAGRPTRSRFGIRSSDRRVVARRIPTQLLESGTGLFLALVSWAVVTNDLLGVDGLAFVLFLVAYFLVRQALLRARVESRPFSWRRSAPSGILPGSTNPR